MRERPAVRALLDAAGRAAARLPVSPAGFTLAGGAFGLGMAAAVAFRAYGPAIALGLFAAFCDIADGAVARRRGEATPAGRLLDVTVDKYVEGAAVIAAAWGAPPLFGLPALLYAAVAIWGSILIAVVSNVGEAAAGGRRPGHWAWKVFSRGERGIVYGAGLALAWASGDERWLTGLILASGGALSHATALGLALAYLRMLRFERPPVATPAPFAGQRVRGSDRRGSASAPG